MTDVFVGRNRRSGDCVESVDAMGTCRKRHVVTVEAETRELQLAECPPAPYQYRYLLLGGKSRGRGS